MDPHVTSVISILFWASCSYPLSPPFSDLSSFILNCVIENIPIEPGAWPLSIFLGNLIFPRCLWATHIVRQKKPSGLKFGEGTLCWSSPWSLIREKFKRVLFGLHMQEWWTQCGSNATARLHTYRLRSGHEGALCVSIGIDIVHSWFQQLAAIQLGWHSITLQHPGMHSKIYI